MVIPDPELDPGKRCIVTATTSTYRGVIILALDPYPESDFQPFGNSGSGLRSSEKWNSNTSDLQVVRERHQHGDDAAECARRLPLGEEGGDHEGEHDEGEAEDLADEEDHAEADALDDDELGDQGDEEGDEGDHHRVDHEPREPKHWVIIQGCR